MWDRYNLYNQLARQLDFPLDESSLFTSKELADEYAADESGVSYIGQIISVVEETESGVTVEVYKINGDRELEKLGTGDAIVTEDIIISGETIITSGTSLTDAIRESIEYCINHGGLIKDIHGDDNIEVSIEDGIANISLKKVTNPQIELPKNNGQD